MGINLDLENPDWMGRFKEDKKLEKQKKEFTKPEARDIGEKLGIDFGGISLEQFRLGIGIEMEHGKKDPETNVTNDDPLLAGKIAWAHLKENGKYYEKLLKIRL